MVDIFAKHAANTVGTAAADKATEEAREGFNEFVTRLAASLDSQASDPFAAARLMTMLNEALTANGGHLAIDGVSTKGGIEQLNGSAKADSTDALSTQERAVVAAMRSGIVEFDFTTGMPKGMQEAVDAAKTHADVMAEIRNILGMGVVVGDSIEQAGQQVAREIKDLKAKAGAATSTTTVDKDAIVKAAVAEIVQGTSHTAGTPREVNAAIRAAEKKHDADLFKESEATKKLKGFFDYLSVEAGLSGSVSADETVKALKTKGANEFKDGLKPLMNTVATTFKGYTANPLTPNASTRSQVSAAIEALSTQVNS